MEAHLTYREYLQWLAYFRLEGGAEVSTAPQTPKNLLQKFKAFMGR